MKEPPHPYSDTRSSAHRGLGEQVRETSIALGTFRGAVTASILHCLGAQHGYRAGAQASLAFLRAHPFALFPSRRTFERIMCNSWRAALTQQIPGQRSQAVMIQWKLFFLLGWAWGIVISTTLFDCHEDEGDTSCLD